VLLCLAAVLLFVAPSRGAHIAALALLLTGGSVAAGGFYWGAMLRGAQGLLALEPRQMLMDRWVTLGPRVGAWKTRLRTPGGVGEMLGSYQLASTPLKRASDAACLVYGPSHAGGLVVVSMGDFTLIGNAEHALARDPVAA
jgi:hypothetical protein